MKFTIDDIIAGWFNVTLDFGADVYCIMATDIHQTDTPRQILKMAADSLTSSDACRCVLDNEPGAWVIELSGGKLRIYLSREDLCGTASIEGCDLAYETNVDAAEFAGEIYNAFLPYSCQRRKEYESEWMKFPAEEFSHLEKLLKGEK